MNLADQHLIRATVIDSIHGQQEKQKEQKEASPVIEIRAPQAHA
jgi:hypothetical protein